MRNDYSERSERLVGYWWLSLIAGVVLIAIGFIVMVNPAESYFSFATWFGFAVMVTGVLTLVQGLSSNNRYVRRGWLILASIADIIIGIILVFNSLVSAFVMPVLLGAWLLYRGIAMLMQGVDLKSHNVRGSGWLIFYSAIVIVVAIAVLWMPVTLGVEAVILFVAIAFVSYGVSMITLGFRLLDVHRYAKRLGADE
ncbi:MAG: DUF308 domain-containing protein [Alistipes sp.]|nr:DUF308 domain-containing protein [Alistipes sp.]